MKDDHIIAAFAVAVESSMHTVKVKLKMDKIKKIGEASSSGGTDTVAPTGPPAPAGHSYLSKYGGEKVEVGKWPMPPGECDRGLVASLPVWTSHNTYVYNG